mmetsp:Transcript_19864/g.64996  ORF Transcript_19864/g.64996 Transcript_19864/m.64996 type:complete len:285 (+) Transcript_19864:615-1469(+)
MPRAAAGRGAPVERSCSPRRWRTRGGRGGRGGREADGGGGRRSGARRERGEQLRRHLCVLVLLLGRVGCVPGLRDLGEPRRGVRVLLLVGAGEHLRRVGRAGRPLALQLVLLQEGLRLLVHLEQQVAAAQPDRGQQPECAQHALARRKVAEAKRLGLARLGVHRALPLHQRPAARQELGDEGVRRRRRDLANVERARALRGQPSWRRRSRRRHGATRRPRRHRRTVPWRRWITRRRVAGRIGSRRWRVAWHVARRRVTWPGAVHVRIGRGMVPHIRGDDAPRAQ